MKTILVQMSDRNWTLQAIHFACALSRNSEAEIVLLRLMPVRYPGYLGTSFGDRPITNLEKAEITEYLATAVEYGVRLSLQQMQCSTELDALAGASDDLEAEAVFAHVPPSPFPFRRRYRVWALERRLAAAHRQLFTLDRPTSDAEHLPSITMKPAHSLVSK